MLEFIFDKVTPQTLKVIRQVCLFPYIVIAAIFLAITCLCYGIYQSFIDEWKREI